MNFLELPNEIILTICELLGDGDKLNITHTCKKLLSFRELLYFDTEIMLAKIEDLSYKHNFRKIMIWGGSDIYKLKNFKQLRKLSIMSDFSENIIEYVPSTVVDLYINGKYNIKGRFSSSLKYLHFGGSFTQDIKGCLPESITHLRFGNSFNKNIVDCIPTSVKFLEFGFSFNNDIRGCLPDGLKSLILGYSFNKNIKGCLPEGLETLIFGGCFDHNIHNCLPPHLKHLKLGFNFDRDIHGCLPPSIEYLTLSRKFNQNIKDVLPHF